MLLEVEKYFIEQIIISPVVDPHHMQKKWYTIILPIVDPPHMLPFSFSPNQSMASSSVCTCSLKSRFLASCSRIFLSNSADSFSNASRFSMIICNRVAGDSWRFSMYFNSVVFCDWICRRSWLISRTEAGFWGRCLTTWVGYFERL
jgi:hypothetical protein